MQFRHINKDFKNRQVRKTYQMGKHILKFLPNIPNLSEEAAQKVQQLRKILINKHDRRPVVKNFCLETGHEYSLLTKFKVCRHAFKKNVTQKGYAGIRKASW